MEEKCNHPSYALASRGSSSEPNKENDFFLFDCLLCNTRLKWYYNQNKIVELPKGIGLVTVMLED